MRQVLAKMGSRARLAAAGVALVGLGVGAGATAVAVTSPATNEVADVQNITPTSTSTPPAPPAEPTAAVQPPVAPDAQAPEAATVATTVDPVPKTTSRLEPSTTDPQVVTQTEPPTVEEQVTESGIGSTGPDGRYTPAPVRQNPGEPPVIDGGRPVMPPAEPLPGEPGYEGDQATLGG